MVSTQNNFNPNIFPQNIFNPLLFNPNQNMFYQNQFNPLFNPNFMNLNFQNQILFQMMQNNNNINMMQNQNNINIPQNQKHLVDEIIKFYQENEMNFMNYEEKYQIMKLLNHLNPQYSFLEKGNDIEDPLYYVHEKKKLIKFVNCNFRLFNVKVPVSISKKDLYSIAGYFYRFLRTTKISLLLVYMNCILNCDESSIDCISDGDFVIIIEPNYYSDDSYLNSLTDKNIIGEKKNVAILYNSCNRNLVMPVNTTCGQLYKALIIKYGKNYNFLYNGSHMKEIDYRNIPNSSTITMYDINVLSGIGINIIGKEINLRIYEKIENKFQKLLIISVGSLNSIKNIIKYKNI